MVELDLFIDPNTKKKPQKNIEFLFQLMVTEEQGNVNTAIRHMSRASGLSFEPDIFRN